MGPQFSQRESTFPTPCCQAPGLQNYERKNFCCIKPPNLWSLAMAAIEYDMKAIFPNIQKCYLVSDKVSTETSTGTIQRWIVDIIDLSWIRTCLKQKNRKSLVAKISDKLMKLAFTVLKRSLLSIGRHPVSVVKGLSHSWISQIPPLLHLSYNLSW